MEDVVPACVSITVAIPDGDAGCFARVTGGGIGLLFLSPMQFGFKIVRARAEESG